MSRVAALSIRLLSSPHDPAPPWPLGRLADELRALGHSVDVRSCSTGVGDLAGVDVVHAVGLTAGSLLAQPGAPCPWVLSPTWAAEGARPDLGDEWRPVALAAGSVVVSSTDEAAAVNRLGVPRFRCLTLPVLVDCATFTRLGPMANRTERRRLVTVLCGADDGSGEALEVLRSLPRLELVALARAGLAPATIDAFLASADSVGVRSRVVVALPQEPRERAWWLRSAHAVVALGQHPGQPEFVAEAMACGIAVVASPVGAQRDLVVHGVTGFHAAHGDPVAASRALTQVLSDDFAVTALGMAGSERALSRNAGPRVAADLAHAYQQVLIAAVHDAVDDDEPDAEDAEDAEDVADAAVPDGEPPLDVAV
jgi:hypothetical protein